MIGKRSWAVAKKILVLGDPIYGLVDSKGITHLFCNEQAIVILSEDGFCQEADLLRKNLEAINQGTCWADRGWKCLAHYLDPDTQKGLGPWPSAAREGNSYFEQALMLWKQGRQTGAFFYLGAVLHLIQDLCVPHHANGVAFDGHQNLEKWARENRHAFQVKSNGLYGLAGEPEQWIYNNARVAKRFYRPDLMGNREFLHYAVGLLLPLAQRTTAGFMQYFITRLS
ncbi:MAG: zinc dependent phospholipase C family protein [Armatimonadetes bacterium]|nr:zinc dependent phospholipase C family protein [Armatimonadota bacterium]